MSISDGQDANQLVTNAAFLSRLNDSDTIAKVDLKNVDAASGSSIINTQREQNSAANYAGKPVNAVKNALPSWTDTSVGSPSDNLTQRGEALTVTVGDHETRITADEADIADIRTTQGTSDGDVDMGAYTGTVLTDTTTVKANLQELGTQVDTNVLDVTDLQNDKEDKANKNVANGYCPLDASSLVPSANLPSYVDDVLEFANFAAFPGSGETGKIYIAIDTGFVYRWSGSVYVDITSKVDSVNSQTGVVVLDADDISDAATTNKFATSGQLAKVDFISVTQAVDLDTIESDTATNTAKVSAGGSIDTHSDVDTSTVAPTDEQVLTWVNANSKWEPKDAAAGGGGTGQGGINYIINSDFEDGISNVTATSRITPAIELANNIRGTQSLKLTIDTLATTADYADIAMVDIDPIDEEGSKVLTVSFEYTNATDVDFQTGDVQFVLRRLDATAADIPFIGSQDGIIMRATNKVKYTARVQVDSDANSYALRMKVLSAPTPNDSVVILDSIKIGPDQTVPASIITEWATYTPTGTWVTNTNYSGKWRRVGDSMEIEVFITTTGAPTTAILEVEIPDGYVIDTAKLSSASVNKSALGSALVTDGNTGVRFTGSSTFRTTTAIGFQLEGDTAPIDQIIPITWANNDFVVGKATVPIVGWSSGAMLSTTEASLQSIYTFTNSVAPTGSLSASFNTTIFGTVSNDPFGLYNTSTGIWTAPRTGEIDVTAILNITYSSTASPLDGVQVINLTTGEKVTAFEQQSGNSTVGIPTTAGMLKVTKGNTIAVQSSTGGSGPSYNGANSSFSIAYRPDFSTFSVYGESEHIEAKAAIQTYSITTNEWGDLTSISVPPGEWDLTGIGIYENLAGVSTTAGYLGMSTTSGNSTTGLQEGDNKTSVKFNTGAGDRNPLTLPSFRVTPIATTTYYLKARVDTASTNLRISYRLSARRIQ